MGEKNGNESEDETGEATYGGHFTPPRRFPRFRFSLSCFRFRFFVLRCTLVFCSDVLGAIRNWILRFIVYALPVIYSSMQN